MRENNKQNGVLIVSCISVSQPSKVSHNSSNFK